MRRKKKGGRKEGKQEAGRGQRDTEGESKGEWEESTFILNISISVS